MGIMMAKEEQRFRNVALLLDDHKMLKLMADADQRTMTRQLSVLIKREFDKMRDDGMVDA